MIVAKVAAKWFCVVFVFVWCVSHGVHIEKRRKKRSENRENNWLVNYVRRLVFWLTREHPKTMTSNTFCFVRLKIRYYYALSESLLLSFTFVFFCVAALFFRLLKTVYPTKYKGKTRRRGEKWMRMNKICVADVALCFYWPYDHFFFLPKWWNKLLQTLVPVNLPAFICMLVYVCEVQPANDKIKNKMVRNAVTIKCSHKINYIQRSTKSKLVHSLTHTLSWVFVSPAWVGSLENVQCTSPMPVRANEREKNDPKEGKKCAREKKHMTVT